MFLQDDLLKRKHLISFDLKGLQQNSIFFLYATRLDVTIPGEPPSDTCLYS
jgi:hypothetical protein